MPIPFIPLIAAGIATAVGAKKALDAKSDFDDAKYYNNQAQTMVEKTNEDIETGREKTQKALQKLGKTKLEILSGSVYEFVENFEKLKKMNITESEGIEELREINSTNENFVYLKQASYEAKDVVAGGIAAIGSGALVAYGTYDAVLGGLGGMAVASTGAAIGSLSGAAATNATLAWLGGGALSAGGLGIAGGTMVLGGLMAGPAIAIGGIVAAKKADAAYWASRENVEKAKTYAEQGKNIVSQLNAISNTSNQMNAVLKKLNAVFIPQVQAMKTIIEECESELQNNKNIAWNDFSLENKKAITMCTETAKVIKIVLDTSILNEDGVLQEEAKKCVGKGRRFLELGQ